MNKKQIAGIGLLIAGLLLWLLTILIGLPSIFSSSEIPSGVILIMGILFPILFGLGGWALVDKAFKLLNSGE